MSAERTSTVDHAGRGDRCRRAAGLSVCTAFVLAVLSALSTSTVTAQPSPTPSASPAAKIVAMSDVHGAYDAFVSVLKAAKLVDDKLAWSGGHATLVVIGDVLDRGNAPRLVLELLMRLEREASAAGGRAQLVLGNHEVMNLTGDLGYVASEDYAAYTAEESAQERAAALGRFRAAHAGAGGDDTLAAEFARRYPPGFFAQRAAFASGGRFGAWLTRQPVLLVLGDTVFVHGGLPAQLAGKSASDVNAEYSAALHDYLAAFDALVAAGVLHAEDAFGERPTLAERFVTDSRRGGTSATKEVDAAIERLTTLTRSSVFGPNAVYWYRGTVGCGDTAEAERVSRVLASLGAKRVVVGHTPTPNARVLSRFGGSVLRVDTGMQQRGGRASALVLDSGGAAALYAGEPSVAPIAEQPRVVGPRAPGYDDDAQLADALTKAPISARTKRGDGSVVLTLMGERGAINALFEPAGGKRGAPFVPAVAAYRLDALLGFDLVPVAVRREVDGVVGAVYLDASGLPDETARVSQQEGGDAWCPLGDQFASMYLFDALAGSAGRAAGEIRYTSGNWQLALTGNRRLFATSGSIPKYLSAQPLEVSPTLDWLLRALDPKVAASTFNDVLDERRLQAMVARRDALLMRRGH